MNKVHNLITLRNMQAVVLIPSDGSIPSYLIQALLTDIAQLGYTLDGDVLNILKTQDMANFVKFQSTLVETLKDMVGANVQYRPLFKKFPLNVPNDEDYLLDRMVGFITNMFDIVPGDIQPLSCGHVIDPNLFNIDDFGACPICQMQVDETTPATDRPALEDITPLKIISLTTKDSVYRIFTNLLAAKSSISEANKAIIEDLVAHEDMYRFIPANIPMKENVAMIAGLVLTYYNETGILEQHIKTATDILRLAAFLCDGDVSLKEPTRFKFSNRQRRGIMGLLNNIENPLEDMLRYRSRWLRLGEVLHIGAYRKRFPFAFVHFDILRNRPETIKTFNSRIEDFVLNVLQRGDHDVELSLPAFLAHRPGEFARRLDFMLRNFKEPMLVVDKFEQQVVSHLTSPMLFTLQSHLMCRVNPSPFRYFLPKGSVAKMQVTDDRRLTISSDVSLRVLRIINDELVRRYSELDGLGNVLLAPELENYVLPLQQRSASQSLNIISRGSRVKIPDTKAVRLFLYWKETPESGRVDVDLSSVGYDDNWNYKQHISYTNLSGIGSIHSGDIQSAPDGASEFIDFNVDAALKHGIRYVTMNVISYTGQNFDRFEAIAGVMGRQKPDSGEAYEPTTVEHKFDVVGASRHNIPLIFDLKTRELIWADMALTAGVYNNVERADSNIVMMSRAIESMVDTKPTVMDLLNAHCSARAYRFDYEPQDGVEYDTVIDESFASKIDEILANWL